MDSVLVFFIFIRDLLARDFKSPAQEDGFVVSGFTGFVWTGGQVVRGVASFSTSCRPARSSPTL